jgi:hypothetical protein
MDDGPIQVREAEEEEREEVEMDLTEGTDHSTLLLLLPQGLVRIVPGASDTALLGGMAS